LLIAILMAISPGADFVVVTRNSLTQSRKAGLLSTIGIGIALWIHIGYSIAGLAIVINSSPTVFSIIRYLGATYLLWLGFQSFFNKTPLNINSKTESRSDFHYFKMGFLCNALNPKATMFFISIFTQIVDNETPILIQLLYGFIISIVHTIWFSLVSLFITRPGLLEKLQHHKIAMDRCFGVFLMMFGLNLAFQYI
jgi:RhtB (resistance to homoserine/threonine) family protein